MDFRPGWPQSQRKKKHKYLNLTRKLKKLWNMKVTVIPIVIGDLEQSQRLSKRAGGVGYRRTNWDHTNYCIIEVGQNTKKSPEDLRKLAVTQIPVKYHQLTQVWKIRTSSLQDSSQDSGLLRTARILRRVLETWGDLLSLKLQWKTISWHWGEKF